MGVAEARDELVVGEDGLKRCSWAAASEDYRAYHDQEWGREVHGESRLFERITLEAFQSGLAWITILRKRENFRAAFLGFDPEVVAGFGQDDRARLLADAGIVRNRAKIEAAIRNARAVLEVRSTVEGGLEALIWSFAPGQAAAAPRRAGDVPATTPESTALAKGLKKHGFAFVGPTTAYAAMQACGLVNDHFAGCHARTTTGTGTAAKKITPGAVGRRG
jgi:DNA-3-methyladenine glycosylase I